MVQYIHQRNDWPEFTWNEPALRSRLQALHQMLGQLTGQMEALGFRLRDEAKLSTFTEDVLRTSEIEGEMLDAAQVRSSIARRLGLDVSGAPPSDRHVEGIVEMMLDATQHCEDPLSTQRLFAWHAALFPTGHSGLRKIITGRWRDDTTGPMQVVSGPMGRERVHYQAPDASRLKKEMTGFINWVNKEKDLDPLIKAGLGHFWFVTLHPFDDGNGRIARAIADMLLARADGSRKRFYSMSSQIRKERKKYYEILESSQKGGQDVTEWLHWFLHCLERSVKASEETLSQVLFKHKFWQRHADTVLNSRQVKVLNKLLDGFEGHLNSSKYARMTRTSQDTAGRDLADLVEKGLLRKGDAGGRSTHYVIAGQHVRRNSKRLE
jgi:Fic family protein